MRRRSGALESATPEEFVKVLTKTPQIFLNFIIVGNLFFLIQRTKILYRFKN